MSVIWLYSSWNNALDYSRYPRGNTAPTVLPQMHYRYRGSTVQCTLGTVPAVLPWNSTHPHSNYRDITAFPITVSFSSLNAVCKSARCPVTFADFYLRRRPASKEVMFFLCQ